MEDRLYQWKQAHWKQEQSHIPTNNYNNYNPFSKQTWYFSFPLSELDPERVGRREL